MRTAYWKLLKEYLTLMSRVVEMLPQVAAEHPLSEDAALPELLWRRPRLHESPQEGDELSVLLTH